MSDTGLYKGKYRTESTRLKEWDYSSFGHYFVTICTKNRECVFGEIAVGKMELSKIGEMVMQYWLEIPRQFHNVKLDEFVIMPNHVHGIVTIEKRNDKDATNCRDGINPVSTIRQNPMLSERSLFKIIRWFKGRCTYEIIGC
ncbi:MAG TPA: transposase [Thermodesulfobacteriota bacterium]|nr:transposase [Thermodesulfobacteriota bacterium]